NSRWLHAILEGVCEQYDIDMRAPLGQLPPEKLRVLLEGAPEPVTFRYRNQAGRVRTHQVVFPGVIGMLRERHRESQSDWVRSEVEKFMTERPCPACRGARLRPEALAVTVGGLNIMEVSALSVREADRFFAGLQL